MNGVYTKSIEAIERPSHCRRICQSNAGTGTAACAVGAREGLIPSCWCGWGQISSLSASSLTEVEKLPRIKGLSRGQNMCHRTWMLHFGRPQCGRADEG